MVRELVETETASFWYNAPEIETGELRTEEIPTEVFLLPAAAHTEKDGTFTNTQRLLQWHRRAVEPAGDCRSELWFYYHLGRRIREKLAASTEARDRPLLDLTWEYPTQGEHLEPSAEAVLREIGGVGPDGRSLPGYLELRADGSTACGCWIYSGVYADEVNQADRRRPGPTRRAGPGRSGSGTCGGTPTRAGGPGTTTPTSGRPPPPTTTRPTTPRPSGRWTAGARS